MHYPNYIAAKTYGRRGFTVVELEDGTFKGMQYIVGKKDTVKRARHCSMQSAIDAGVSYLTPIERWVDITGDCTFGLVSIGTGRVIAVKYNGEVISIEDDMYTMDDGKIFKKKKYYDS